MDFTPSQISKIIERILCKEDGLNTILKLTLETLMKAERTEYKHLTRDYSNGYRSRKAFGNKQMLELQAPHTRNGVLYPVILSLLKSQEQEARSLGFRLYKPGLTTKQVSGVF
ncbi:MAG: hypothetical protein GX128_10940 [Bacteroidales bacterium]|jgi:transposase-like protein|nr:hypothetical protein [Bacteroidales bacterium]